MDLRVKKVLMEMDFVKKYEALVKKFDMERIERNERLRLTNSDKDNIIELVGKLGYIAKYKSKERYYELEREKIDDFTIGVNLGLERGMAEFIWVIKEKEEFILGTAIRGYSRELIDVDYMLGMPVFKDYDELREILKSGFELFEDFKRGFLKNNSRNIID